MHPYLPHTETDIKAMLDVIGASSIEALFEDIDAGLISKKALNIPGPFSEATVKAHVEEMLNKNQLGRRINFAGGGMYQHDIPEIIGHLTGRSEFYTAYTPYQPEISQGTLQAIFEYQTMICELTGMDASNASHYDGSTAAAEAIMMANKVNKGEKVLVSQLVNPETMQVIRTYCRYKGIEVVEIPEVDGLTDMAFVVQNMSRDYTAVVIQSPNYYGHIEVVDDVVDVIHEQKGLLILSMNPLAMSVFKSPGVIGADIAVGDAQVFGNAMSFGGPSLGFMATTEKLMRKLPGRIVGEAIDHDGHTGYVLTLQAREQHIRRDKATSNITSNQALNALSATIYMALLGPVGLKEVAMKSMANLRYLANALCDIDGIEQKYQHIYFNEIVIHVKHADRLYSSLAEQGIFLGIKIEHEDSLLIATTEHYNKSTLDQVIQLVKETYAQICQEVL